MLKIKQFRFGADNLAYLVFGNRTAIAVDGGAVSQIVAFTSSMNLKLGYVTNTHNHMDHKTGNIRLVEETGAELVDSLEVAKGTGEITIDGEKVEVIHTPGHSLDSVIFSFEDTLITGDTLFNGTVGNCFSGDLKAFYNSIKLILEHPASTRIFAGHDYVGESLAYARVMEPNNTAIDGFAPLMRPDPLYSTLAEELEVNPFLRFNEPSIIEILRKKGLKVDSELERFESIMQL